MLLISMKFYLIFLSVIFTFLLVSNRMNGDSLLVEGRGEEYSLCSETSDCSVLPIQVVDYILPVTSELPDGEMIFENAHSIARQLRGFGRSQRTTALHYTVLNKELLSRLAKFRMDALFQSSHVYTTLILQSWEVPSEHYVFGLRHILI